MCKDHNMSEDGVEFIERTVHDLKTPLTSVIGYAEGLAAAENNPEKRKRYINVINKAAEEMSVILDELESYALLKSDRVSIRTEECSLKDLFVRLEKEVKKITAGTGAATSCRLNAADTDLRVRTDMFLIVCAVQNIIRYMLEFLPDKGGSVYFALSFRDGRLLTEFCDNGLTPSPDELDRLFEEHRRVYSGRIQKKSGSGLGLLIAKRIALLLKGSIDAAACESGGMKIEMKL